MAHPVLPSTPRTSPVTVGTGFVRASELPLRDSDTEDDAPALPRDRELPPTWAPRRRNLRDDDGSDADDEYEGERKAVRTTARRRLVEPPVPTEYREMVLVALAQEAMNKTSAQRAMHIRRPLLLLALAGEAPVPVASPGATRFVSLDGGLSIVYRDSMDAIVAEAFVAFEGDEQEKAVAAGWTRPRGAMPTTKTPFGNALAGLIMLEQQGPLAVADKDLFWALIMSIGSIERDEHGVATKLTDTDRAVLREHAGDICAAAEAATDPAAHAFLKFLV